MRFRRATMLLPARPRLLAVLLGASLAVMAAACTTEGSPTPRTASPGSPSPSAPPLTPVPTTTDGSGASPSATVTTTDTAWGRIWDALPGGFPRYPGSIPTETGLAGPVSAEFAVPAGPDAVTTWLQASLEGDGYSTEALSGPLEDGSRVIDSVAAGGCRVQTVITPLSGTTHVTVRFGAACPFS